ncbi:alpha-E domain-containing protein [Oleiharenicola lentus]|uniref:alpha-E domain-containing protein n=1 Tax=Oleiharenicola lentus TaxID=2508720 RepID=UPI003F66A337
MLSRVANSLYWMSRYIERAENIARLVDVNLQLLLDFRNLDDAGLAAHWLPIVQSSGDDELFQKLHPHTTGQTVTEFLVFQTENPNSIVSSISQARENARMVRDQITAELWEELNRLYLFLRSDRATEMWFENPADFFTTIRNGSLLLQGLTDATAVRNEGWSFIQAGRYLERADKTSRILDVRHASLPSKGVPAVTNQSDALGWSAVLRSCSAWDGYKALHGAEIQPALVADFLLLSDEFPRSVRFCVRHLNNALRRISGVAEGRFTNDAEKLAGRLLAEFQFSTADDVFDIGLHTYIDVAQAKLNAIGDALFQAYIFQPFQTPEDYELRQQEEQQQQSLSEFRVSETLRQIPRSQPTATRQRSPHA